MRLSHALGKSQRHRVRSRSRSRPLRPLPMVRPLLHTTPPYADPDQRGRYCVKGTWMNNRGTLAGGLWTAIATLAMGVPVTARADSAQDEWQWSGTIYVWLPSLNGQSSFPVSSGGSSISVDGSDILDSLNFAFMGMLQGRKGQWGFA